jgi:hypothetical protein
MLAWIQIFKLILPLGVKRVLEYKASLITVSQSKAR